MILLKSSRFADGISLFLNGVSAENKAIHVYCRRKMLCAAEGAIE